MAGTGLIQLEWWDLPAWILFAFWPITVFAIIACMLAALHLRNKRLAGSLADAWVVLGMCLLLFLALIVMHSFMILPEVIYPIYEAIGEAFFIDWGFLGLTYMAITTVVIVRLNFRKFFLR